MSLDVYLTCPCCQNEVYESNITHNVGGIAEKAGIYMPLWRPDEMVPPLTVAGELVAPLEAGLAYLREHREELLPLEPKNKWGTVDGLISFVEEYLKICREWPNTQVRVSR